MQVAKMICPKTIHRQEQGFDGFNQILTESLAGAVLAVLIGWRRQVWSGSALVSFQVFGVISLLIYIFRSRNQIIKEMGHPPHLLTYI